MTIYFAPLSTGIGDLVICLPVCKWLIENNEEPVVLVARGPRQEGLSSLIPGISGEINEPQLIEKMRTGDRLINLRDHPLQKHHDWFSDQFQLSNPGFYVLDMLSRICGDMGMPVDLAKIEPLQFTPDLRAREKIILVPGSTMQSKMIDPQVWLNLHRSLQKRGVDTLMLGQPQWNSEIDILRREGIEHIETHDLAHAINLVSSAAGMAAVDTGLMHIGVQQGIGTVAIFGQCEIFYRPAKNCIPIFTNSRLRQNTSLPTETPRPDFDFPVYLQTWNWLPESAVEGEYLSFNDHEQIISALYKLGSIG